MWIYRLKIYTLILFHIKTKSASKIIEKKNLGIKSLQDVFAKEGVAKSQNTVVAFLRDLDIFSGQKLYSGQKIAPFNLK